jgi:hypothetical protein
MDRNRCDLSAIVMAMAMASFVVESFAEPVCRIGD